MSSFLLGLIVTFRAEDAAVPSGTAFDFKYQLVNNKRNKGFCLGCHLAEAQSEKWDFQWMMFRNICDEDRMPALPKDNKTVRGFAADPPGSGGFPV